MLCFGTEMNESRNNGRMEANTFVTRPLNFEAMNEADVRAEFLDPMLRSLGYQAGTENNIIREGLLRHAFIFLGRKKKSDPPLTGKPDYVLESGSHGRWVLEAKPPTQPLTREEFEQAQSYALHPNVAAAIFVLSNGRETRIYRAIDQDFDQPILRMAYEEVGNRWLEVQALLSPSGFKRHFPAPNWSPGLPIAPEYGAAIRLGGGEAVPSHVKANILGMESQLGVLANLTNHIARGKCWRDSDGRLRIECDFRGSSAVIQQWLENKGIASIRLETDDEFISCDEANPTLIRGWMATSVATGEQMFDMSTWQMMTIPFPMTIEAMVTATVFLSDDHIIGDYSLMMTARLSIQPDIMMIEQIGSLTIDVVQ